MSNRSLTRHFIEWQKTDAAMVLATVLRDSGDQDGALEIAYTLARRHPENQNVVALLRTLDAIP